MFSRILLATDGSEASIRALHKAVVLALNLGAEIHIVNIAELCGAGGEAYIPMMVDSGSSMAASQREILETAAQNVRAYGLSPITHALSGAVASEIVSLSHEIDADVIVIGAPHSSTWERLILGSTSDSIVRHAGCSVLVARSSCRCDGQPELVPCPTFRRILLAADGSDSSIVAAKSAAWLALRLKSRLSILHVFESPLHVHVPVVSEGSCSGDAVSAFQETVIRKVRDAISRYEILAQPIKRIGTPTHELERFTREHCPDLVVVGTSHYGTLKTNLVGGVGEFAARQCPCSVLIAR